MRVRVLSAAVTCCAFLAGGAATTSAGTIAESDQFGVNFIRFGDATSSERYLRPANIFSDWSSLGVNVARQLTSGDPLWETVEPENDEWNWSTTDSILMNMPQEPIVTLFRYQYTDGTPPWTEQTYAGPVRKTFIKTLESDARDYVEHVVDRYKDYVKYWEVGNEMDHWRALEGEESDSSNTANEPPAYAEGQTFTPYEQGQFYAQVRSVILERDPDAVVLMPGMGGIEEWNRETWLPEFVEGAGGSSAIDAINYHSYGPYLRGAQLRSEFSTKLDELGLGDKPVLNTETGVTSDSTLISKTNYPNSQETQAADLVRRTILGWSNGDSMTIWHTYIGADDSGSDWRYYGLRLDTGTPQPVYSTFKLLTRYLYPIDSVTLVDGGGASGRYVYQVTTADGDVLYVLWGSRGAWSPPAVMQKASVYSSTGTFSWSRVRPSDSIVLTDTPVILR